MKEGHGKCFLGKPEGKRPVGRPRMRWENNINHDFREMDYTGDDWKSLAELVSYSRLYTRAHVLSIPILISSIFQRKAEIMLNKRNNTQFHFMLNVYFISN